MNLFRENENGTWTLVAQNHQYFEGLDALVIDGLLETDGTYIMEVFAPDIVYLAELEGVLSLDLSGNGDFRVGDYYLSIYKTGTKA